MKLPKAVVALHLFDRYAVSILLAFCILYNSLFVLNFAAIKVIVRDSYDPVELHILGIIAEPRTKLQQERSKASLLVPPHRFPGLASVASRSSFQPRPTLVLWHRNLIKPIAVHSTPIVSLRLRNAISSNVGNDTA